METPLEHEKRRFSQMNAQQLKTRLFRITNREKLEAFIRTAQSYGHIYLASIAIDRYNSLFCYGAKKASFPPPEGGLEYKPEKQKLKPILYSDDKIKFWKLEPGDSSDIQILPPEQSAIKSSKSAAKERTSKPNTQEQEPKKQESQKYKRSLEF